MARRETFGSRWAAYQPSKTTWFWSAVASSVATMIIGFTAGGWTTGGTANEMVENAARAARAEMASIVCVQKFTSANDAGVKLAELKETSSYKQDDFIEDGGWALPVGFESAVPGAADRCADELVAMEHLPTREIDTSTTKSDS